VADEPPTEPARRRVNPLLRFLAGVWGLSLVGLGQASAASGGVFGIGLALVLDLAGVAIILIAVGVVEWWARRHPGATER
jgi:uncharacterized iron-regulated membrane protein